MVLNQNLPVCLEKLIFSFLETKNLFFVSLANKKAYDELLTVRLLQELHYTTDHCFKCKNKRVSGVQFKDYYTKTSSFCPNHVIGYKLCSCLTTSHEGKNVSYTPTMTIYWPNKGQHGFNGNPNI